MLSHMAPEEARVFEDHYLTCARCPGFVEEAETFVLEMKRATERLRRQPEM